MTQYCIKNTIPRDILSLIFQYDNTYREKMNNVISGLEIKYKLWDMWKNKLFMCKKLVNDNLFRSKMEFILDFYFNEIFMETNDFPTNIEIYCGWKLFYYSNKTENKMRAAEIFTERGNIEKNKFEIVFTFTKPKIGEINQNIQDIVFTKEEYYYNSIYCEKDIYGDYQSFYNDNNFYLLEHYMNDGNFIHNI